MRKFMLMTSAALMMAAAPTLAQEAASPPADTLEPAADTATDTLSPAQTGAQSAIPAADQSAATPQAAPSGDLVATAQSQGEFKTLTRAIEAAGMTEQLKGGQFVTLFAPTDAAFAALPAGTVDNLLKPENKEQLKSLLSNHLVPGYANSAFLAQQSNSVMETVGGGKVAIDSADGKVTVSGAHVVTADVRATNGLIHGIDKVLMPGSDRQASAGAPPAGGS